jgi:hypothetical protein
MGVYVDAGVNRIQEYLLRTSGADDRQLRKRRGASLMVAAATSPDAFADLGLERNAEAYHVEGVAHLLAVAATGEDLVECAREWAALAAQRLRNALPHAYLRVSWAVADSYAAAHPLLAAARDSGQCGEQSGSISVLPALRATHSNAATATGATRRLWPRRIARLRRHRGRGRWMRFPPARASRCDQRRTCPSWLT